MGDTTSIHDLHLRIVPVTEVIESQVTDILRMFACICVMYVQ